MVVCHRVCDYHHDHLEEEERLTTMVTTTGGMALGEGCHYDTKRTKTSSDYIIRLTDRLLRCGTKIISCFSHGSRAGTTTRRDKTTTRVAAAAACNGTDYNNCDVSTTATPTSSDTESTTSASIDHSTTPTSCADYDTVDLINPLSDDCTHYIMMLGPAAKPKGPPPPPLPPAAGAGAGAGAGAAPAAPPPPLPVMLPQGRLPQPTVFDGTTPPFQEWIQEIRNFLSINNYEFIRQMDYSLQSDVEVTLRDVTDSTTVGAERRNALTVNETAQDDLYRELDIPLNERADVARTDDAINAEIEVLRTAHIPLEQTYNEWKDRLERGGDYLNYMLIHGTKLGTEANNYIRGLQRSTNGYEALRLMRLRFSGGQMLQNYQLLRDILNPKFTESQQHFQYRQRLESLSRYELESRQPLDDR